MQYEYLDAKYRKRKGNNEKHLTTANLIKKENVNIIGRDIRTFVSQ